MSCPALDRHLRLFGHNRRAVFSFRDKDHGDGERSDSATGSKTSSAAPDSRSRHPAIRVLCYPRIFGYVFNPLTVFFCYDARGHLARHPLRGQQHFRRAPHLRHRRRRRCRRYGPPERAEGALRLALRPDGRRLTISHIRLPGRPGAGKNRRIRRGWTAAARLILRPAPAADRPHAAPCAVCLSADDAEGHRRHPLGGAAPLAEGRTGVRPPRRACARHQQHGCRLSSPCAA